jgi:ThiS family
VVRAATVGGAADALAVVFDRHVTVALNGDQVTRDRATPLAAGDTVFFLPAAAGRVSRRRRPLDDMHRAVLS